MKDYLKNRRKEIAVILGAVLLSTLLMLIFKYNPAGIGEFIDEQKANIKNLYMANLTPVLFDNEITIEDVFNFALYNRIAYDKKSKKYLDLGKTEVGKEYIGFVELKNSEPILEYKEFKSGLKLNEREDESLDSILGSYGPRLREQILSNSNKTIALDVDLWRLNKIIMADIYRYLYKINKAPRFEHEFSSFARSDSALNAAIAETRDLNKRRYMVINPDTIFYAEIKLPSLTLKEQKLKYGFEDIEKAKLFVKSAAAEINEKYKSGELSVFSTFKFEADENRFAFNIDETPVIFINASAEDSLYMKLADIDIYINETGRKSSDKKTGGKEGFNFQMTLPDETGEKNKKLKIAFDDGGDFELQIDSLNLKINGERVFLKENADKFKLEMELFAIQMKEWAEKMNNPAIVFEKKANLSDSIKSKINKYKRQKNNKK